MLVNSGDRTQIEDIPTLLAVLAQETNAKGVALLGFETSEDSLLILECMPAGLTGRRIPMIGRFSELADTGIRSSQDIILPTTLTRWLGGRPQQVCLQALHLGSFSGYLLFCWREDAPVDMPLARILAGAAGLLSTLIERHLGELEQRRLADQFGAIMNNASLGIAFTDATGRSTVNPIAAELLGLPTGEGDAGTLANAMRDRRDHCVVRSGHDVDAAGTTVPGAGKLSAADEYWTYPAESGRPPKVVKIESYAIGDTQNPGRVWLFSDVTQLWDAAARMQSINAELKSNNAQLADEIDKRAAVEATLREREAELRRYTEDLEISRSSIERRAHEAVELAEELAQQKEELENSKKQSDYLANHDPLTGLANRRAFRDRLSQMMEAALGAKGQVALLFIDLDKFKAVNDTLGHDAGDQLLKQVAAILTEALRDTDLLARFGGDEFAIATRVPANTDIGKIVGLADRIRQKLQIPMPAPSGTIDVCGTIGIGLFPTDAADMDNLFIAADQAMYAGKKRGRNCVVLFKELGEGR